jgi:hypothetical protein
VTPTAGTDYPCADQNIPGHERFYTMVEGEFNYNNWLESVRLGKTFVTTGPVIEFNVEDQGIGGEVLLDQTRTVRLSGNVQFDPTADALQHLELIQNGQVIRRFSRLQGAANIEFDIAHKVTESSWFALRGEGMSISENTLAQPMHFSNFQANSLVHTAPIYVTLKDGPGISESEQAKRIARTWLARLLDIEASLAEENLDFLAMQLSVPDIDAVPKETLIANREALLQEIDVAKRYFSTLAK